MSLGHAPIRSSPPLNTSDTVWLFSKALWCVLIRSQPLLRLTGALQTIADAGYLSARPLPEAPDGRYDYEVKPLTGTIAESDPHSDLYKTTHSVGDTLKNAPVFVKDLLDPKVRWAGL